MNIKELQMKQALVGLKIDAKLAEHRVSVLTNDGLLESKIRAEIHDLIDSSLDNTVNILKECTK